MSFRFAIAQLNPTVGDFDANVAKILEAYAWACEQGADLLVTSEMVVAGYQIDDLSFNEGFHRSNQAALAKLAEATAGQSCGLLVGSLRLADESKDETAYLSKSVRLRGRIHNTAYLMADGAIQAHRDKAYLPTYGVFDELRAMTPGELPGPMSFKGRRLGVCTCEDVWHADVCETLVETGAEILIAMNGSVFAPDMPEQRQALAVSRVVEHQVPIIYTNLNSGQDRLVFDGGSFALNADRSLACLMPQFQEARALLDWSEDGQLSSDTLIEPLSHEEQLYETALLGLRDYLRKTGHKKVLLGLSGGIDSAITLVMAVDALGADNVKAYMLPSPYTSQDSLDDAAQLAANLGVALKSISIEPAMQAFEAMLSGSFAGTEVDETEENIQSRARGLTLMALSNKSGALLLTTGNKSEVAVGYATMYGDMCGALNLIGDLYKTQVFQLSSWRNSHKPGSALGPEGAVMPERIITKPPSAELRPDQKDQDSLPDYETLDAILFELVENEASVSALLDQGWDQSLVKRIYTLLHRAEFKRQQAAPTIKMSIRAFGSDRQMPIVNRYWPFKA